jgi:hypothetical protein
MGRALRHGGDGEHLVVVDPVTGGRKDVATGPLGALALADDGYPLALAKADRLLRIDPTTLQAVDRSAVDVNDEHMEVVVAAGAAWVASDHTPLRRLSLPDLSIDATLDVGGGIPFVLRDPLIWGRAPASYGPSSRARCRSNGTFELPGVTEVLALDVDGNDAWVAVRRGRAGPSSALTWRWALRPATTRCRFPPRSGSLAIGFGSPAT